MAKKVLLPPDEPAPLFDGFEPEMFKFLHGLKKNNNKEWFEKHRKDYEMHLREPSKAFVLAMSALFREHKLPFVANPKTSLFRINRDIRFSKDKSPYKTHIGVVFPLEKTSNNEWCGMYLGMEPAAGKTMKAHLGGGVYMPESAFLKKIRTRIAEDPKQFEKLNNDKSFRKMFAKGITGDTLKRIPQGYTEDHPAAQWLKLKSFLVNAELTEKDLLRDDLPERLAPRFEAAVPMLRFLVGG